MSIRSVVATILIFISLPLTAQSWQYKEGNDPFDGKYRTSYVVGTGGEFPYQNPVFTVNRFFSSPDKPNIYFSDVPSSVCDGNYVQFKFDNDPHIFTQIASGSKDGDTWFIRFSNVLPITTIDVPKISDGKWKDYKSVDIVVGEYFSFTIRSEANSWSDVLCECVSGDTVKILNYDQNKGYWLVAFNNPSTRMGGIGFVRYNSVPKDYPTVVDIYNNPHSSDSIVQSLSSLHTQQNKDAETELGLFLRYIKTHSKMYVRMRSECVSADYVFSLSGSIAAINYVFK
jgi:hypothetical protein